MKKILFVLALLLLVVACKSDSELQAVILEDGQDEIPVKEPREEPKEDDREEGPARVDTEEDKEEEFSDVTEVKTYDVKGKCTRDSKGVVRHFDEGGKKTVYRNECSFGFLIEYDCDGNAVTSETKTCLGECVSGAYGDVCQ